MIITLTGTPGTGKTTIAEKLTEEELDTVHLTEFLEERGIGEIKNGEREVPIQEMVKEIENENFDGDTVIEGHLSHHLSSDICIVLRCQPDILEDRLSDRDYSDQKIQENVEAEALDIILSEAVGEQDVVIEIDTTGKSVEETVDEILDKLDKRESDYGNVNWSGFL